MRISQKERDRVSLTQIQLAGGIAFRELEEEKRKFGTPTLLPKILQREPVGLNREIHNRKSPDGMNTPVIAKGDKGIFKIHRL